MVIEHTSEGAVVISYPILFSSPETLLPAIEKAFGPHPDALGIILVRDLPQEYGGYRDKLLKLAYQFAQLDENVRESYSDPASKYSFGWSHGKEMMDGRPDTLKGSYYANPIVEDVTVSDEVKKQFPEYYGRNIWPKENEQRAVGFEKSFKDLSALIFKVGCQLAAACQPFVSSYFVDATVSLSDLIVKSQTTKGRLLHYFPPCPDDVLTDTEAIGNWCGFHLDHSLLTGLCPAMFLRRTESGEPEVIAPLSPNSGLYIRTRGGNLTKVSIPSNCLAFQTGEALEIATNGRLLATPHCVRVGTLSGTEGISRESFVLFMQPNTDVALSTTTTFGEFSKKILEKHYENTM